MAIKSATSTGSDRLKTRYRGVTYRELRSGERTYSVYHGGRYVKVEGGEAEALVLQAELRREKSRGARRPGGAAPTFEALSKVWLAGSRVRPYTRKAYQEALNHTLLPEFRSRKVTEISVSDVVGLIRRMEERGLSSSSIGNYMLPLSGTLDLAVRDGHIDVNPYRRLTRSDRPARRERKAVHCWTDSEIEALLAAAERLARKPEARQDYSALLRVAVSTGLRLGELLGLRWEDVDLDERKLHVRRQWTRLGTYDVPKTPAALRYLPLPDDLVAFLRAYRLKSRFSLPEHPVFAGRDGRPLSHRNAAQRGFEKAAEKAGITGVSMHSTRHAYASRMISRGVSATVLAKFLGHGSASVTERVYVSLFNRLNVDDEVRAAMAL